jgi:ubiquinone/menaquinone biosynthesis C-methylase UbiE
MARHSANRRLALPYTELAPLYDAVYMDKSYSGEVRYLRAEIRAHCRSGGRELLDVGCGTGHHIQYLQKRYRCTGLDASREMLKEARKRLPRVPLIEARMESFNIDKQFDAVICMFGAIGYTRTLPGLRKAVRCMARHLRPGGVLLIQPFETPSAWKPGTVITRVTERMGFAVARVTSSSEPRPSLARMEMQYLIASKFKPIQHFSEVHELGLFAPRTIQEAIKAAGLQAKFIPRWHKGHHGMHIGVRPLS